MVIFQELRNFPISFIGIGDFENIDILKEREVFNLGVILKMSYFLKEREGDNLQMVNFQEFRFSDFQNGEFLNEVLPFLL